MIKDDISAAGSQDLAKVKTLVAEKAAPITETSALIKNEAAALIRKPDDLPVMSHRSLANSRQVWSEDNHSVAGFNSAAGGQQQIPLSSALSSLSSTISSVTGLQFTLMSPNLPANTFAVASFELQEAFSAPYLLSVELASHDANIDFGDVLDENAVLTVWRDGVPERHVSGVVTAFEQGDTGFHRTRYSMKIRPAFWRTTLRQNSRIFQNETIESIIDTLMKENGRIDCAYSFRFPHPAREFCVQYQESDFDFIQRLTAEEGIFYYFEFEAGKQRVVFTDDATAQSDEVSLPYNPNRGAQAKELCVCSLKRSEQVRPAQVKLKDYTFKNPVWPAEFSQQAKNADHQRTDYEHYDFPGRFKDEQHGEAFSRYRIEALRNDANQGKGESNSFAVQPGVFLKIDNHPRTDMNRQWQIVQTVHTGHQPQALEEEGGAEQGTTLTNQFIFMPHNQTWRPTPLPKPKMDGPQIALVVGPPSEEIYTDQYGRVRLKFLWDRYSSGDDNSSCWIRVTQPWAGKGWGVIAIPRIGQEVVVDFLHGDPDQPIVTGRTYHANNLPSLGLPAAKTQMAFRSNTHKGSGYNELKFEDEAGKEELSMHAQKDMNTKVNNDRGTNVGNNHSENVGNNQDQTIGNNQTVNVGTDQSVTIGSNQTLTVGANQTETVTGNQSITVASGNRTVKVGSGKQETEVATTDSLKVGAKQTTEIGAGQDYKVTGKQKIDIDGPQKLTVTASQRTKVGTSQKINVGTSHKLVAGTNIVVQAGDSIKFQCGASSIEMDSAGNITITGVKIQNAASDKHTITASKVNSNGSAENIVEGAVVKLNP